MSSIVLLPRSAKRFAEELLLILATAPTKKVSFISIGKSMYILSKTHVKAS